MLFVMYVLRLYMEYMHQKIHALIRKRLRYPKLDLNYFIFQRSESVTATFKSIIRLIESLVVLSIFVYEENFGNIFVLNFINFFVSIRFLKIKKIKILNFVFYIFKPSKYGIPYFEGD